MFTKKLSWLENKTIFVIGMAREGLSTVEFLLSQVPTSQIVVSDDKLLTELDPAWSRLLEKESRVSYQRPNAVQNQSFDVVFKTPGIPHRILTDHFHLDINQVKLYSNTQLFFDLLSEFQVQPITIGITGTKGKSTTTSMIYHVLSDNLDQVFLAGNIGVPPLRLLEKAKTDEKNIFVLEMSCHQLADLTTSPQIAVALDISPDHLDYYPTFEDYFQAKTAICRFQQPDDLVFFNQDSKTATRMAKLSAGQKRPFSLDDHELIEFIHQAGTNLAGEHNLYNTMPAVLIARELGLNDQKIAKSISTFKPVPHRLELVRTINQISFYDDSASSAPEATVAALKAFAGQPVVLIVGGSEKGVEFDTLADAIKQANLRHLILFPTTGEKILAAVLSADPNSKLSTNHRFAHSMPEAVQIASQVAQAGDVVLLSPACASYNMFKNYEDRGNQFQDQVRAL